MLHSRLALTPARLALTLGLFFALLGAGPLSAAGLASPTGPVILTVDGTITNDNGDKKARFDLPMLKSLGVHKMHTITSWTDGMIDFEGVLVRDVLKAAGASGAQVNAVALDDYSSLVPMADFTDYDVILAFSMNGKALTRRDKGPLWIIYPWTDHPELNVKDKVSHAVWQLKRLTVQ